MVDGQYRSYGEYAWRAYLKRERGDHNARPNRCAWILDASGPQACSKQLKRGDPGPYCPKHARLWRSRVEEARKVDHDP